MTYADWKELCPELLAAIAKLLTSTKDYISFRGVCKSWESAATFDNFDSAFPRIPWLLFSRSIPIRENPLGIFPTPRVHVYKILDLSEEINLIFTTANIQEEEAKKYYLSCSGWLLGVAKSNAQVHLTHLIRHNRLELPDLDTLPGYAYHLLELDRFIKRMVLSGNPMVFKSDLLVMVIWGEKNQLGFSRPGDSAWTVMQYWNRSFTDILYHKGKLYAIDDDHRVVECDIHGDNPTRMHQIMSFDYVVDKYPCYMVESSGNFLIVPAQFNVGRFRVIEFDLINGSHKEIRDLGNRTLFLSRNSSVCVEGCAWNDEVQPNCMYFANPGMSIRFHLGTRRLDHIFGRDLRMIGSSKRHDLTFCTPLNTASSSPAWVVPGF